MTSADPGAHDQRRVAGGADRGGRCRERRTTMILDRIVHTYGKSVRDLLRLRAGDIPRVPDVVVYPADEAEVQLIVDRAVAADAVLIPFGGGSNISGSLHAPEDETRPVISVDLGRLNQVIDIDEESGLARIQAGALGPDLEEQLGARGWTLGHFPDSFTHSTLGGWVATRSSGMQSDKYGDIADIARGHAGGHARQGAAASAVAVHLNRPERARDGLGSEGRLGVITEVTVQVHRIPEERMIFGYLFPSWEAGLAAMQEISTSDAHPSVTRVSDAKETAFSFATRKKSSRHLDLLAGQQGPDEGAGAARLEARRGLPVVHRLRGRQGARARQKAMVKDIVGQHGGIVVGKGPGELYDQKKFDTPYIRDFLLDRGAVGDVSETAAPWSRLMPLYDNVIAAAEQVLRPNRRHGLDHVPPVALLPLRRVPVLHLRVQARRGRPAGAVRAGSRSPSSRRSSTPAARCRTTTPSAPSMRLAGAGHLRARRAHDRRAVHRDGSRAGTSTRARSSRSSSDSSDCSSRGLGRASAG